MQTDIFVEFARRLIFVSIR